MKIGTFLILQALFTGGAIFVYDTVRSDSAPASAPAAAEPQEVHRPRSAPAEARPLLVGAGMDDLMRRVAALERSQAAPRPASGAKVVEGSTPGSSEGPPAPNLPFPVGTNPAQTEFDPQQLATFRAMQEIVEKQRQEERRYNMYKEQIKLLGLNLSEDQEKVVIQTTIHRDMKRGEALRELGPAGDRDARTAARDAVQAEWVQAIEAKLPAFEAQKIVEWGARSWGGMGRRQPGAAGDLRGPEERQR